jgi:hypothetical protein
MSTLWGVDSLSPIDSAAGGTTLANYVINQYYAGNPHDEIVFWGRYFTNAYYPGYVWRGDTEATALLDAVRAYEPGGSGWVVPIDVPRQTELSGDFDTGHSEGLTFGNAVAAALSTTVSLPGSQTLHVYLDVEVGSLISAAYWQGWATAVNNYQIGSGYPLYACAYLGSIGSGTGTTNAATIGAAQLSATTRCYGTWSNQPQLSGGSVACQSPGPGWAPNNAGGLPTLLWQYGDAGVCSANYYPGTPVDLDSANPAITGPYGNGEADFMLWCH